MRRRRPSDETLVTLRGKLEELAPRSVERQHLLQDCADLHGVSVATVYRALREQFRPRSLYRRDRGRPRLVPQPDMERFCELVAAMKLRTTNQKGRHLSTGRALELLVEHGIETPDGLVQAPPGLLTRTTVNRYLKAWGLDDERMGRPPPAQRFQAEHVNDCWQFDLSPSDLKQVPAPLWTEPGRGPPTLMLFSAVDDRSGVAYQEYRCVYGEDVAAALRFLFNAMSSKDEPGLVLQGIPAMLYLDNGPVAKSGSFKRVMAQLGGGGAHPHAARFGRSAGHRAVEGQGGAAVPHGEGGARDAVSLPHAAGRGGGQPVAAPLPGPLQCAAASVGPAFPGRGLVGQPAASGDPGDVHLGPVLRFCPRARAPPGRDRCPGPGGRRGLRGRTCFGGRDGDAVVGAVRPRTLRGACRPAVRDRLALSMGRSRCNRYRSFRKSAAEGRLDRIEALAGKLGLPRAALDGPGPMVIAPATVPPTVPFNDPDPFQELHFPSVLAAKLAIADYLGRPLAKLAVEDLDTINALLGRTLERRTVIACVRGYFRERKARQQAKDGGHAR